MAEPIFTRGQFVRLTYNGQTREAMVMLASPNGRSLMLGYAGALHSQSGGMYAGSIALLRDDEGVYRDLIESEPAVVEPRLAQ